MDCLAEGIAAQRAGQVDDAMRLFRAAARATPLDNRPRHNLGWLLYERRQVQEAEAEFRAAMALKPEETAHHMGLGYVLQQCGRFAEAEAEFREALRLSPDHNAARVALSFQILAQGRLAEGFALSEHRVKPDATGQFTMPEWRGEPLDGRRLLVWREQGFGDQIQMARFLPALTGGDITYSGFPPIAPIIEQFPGIRYQRLVDMNHYDLWTVPMSLPHRLGVTEQTLPTAPYISGRATRRGGIGVMWRGNAQPDPDRSLPQALAGALLSLPGAVSLAPEDTGATDFQATADLIAGLDAVVSVDTSVAHLAGAMGKPLHVMLPALGADWRWMRGETCIWYPTARLHRQTTHGDWGPVLEAVIRALT